MTTINYPHKFEVGDIVFTSIGTELFRQIASASQCWSNHVGMIVGHDGDDYLIAESRVPLSTTTTLSRFISRSSDKRYSVRRLRQSLTQEQKKALVAQVPLRLNKFYHTGFNYDSSRQFCSKFVFDIYQSALSIQIGEIETFEALLTKNPNAKLNFWKLWFIGHIPWERTTVTPASLWHHPELSLVYRSHQDIH
ncbi:YebB family permuted papain-like enzyme [Providencia rettgeri]|nr:YebB family permuted papain-like enzyme [Providencia rettgeri]ELQ1456073.1 YebB family permuted papain-like enzyme [Providencia rettgeri]ELQ1458928.1 YebB family permuted papain-like enzyme [Providencia rettgeri]ELR5185244.1 YebB family permuted papain-like enzyme [Providencia rettgeri]EMB0750080.1 YebB family permuted papain-like enzyme [Providencia rettgeri]